MDHERHKDDRAPRQGKRDQYTDRSAQSANAKNAKASDAQKQPSALGAYTAWRTQAYTTPRITAGELKVAFVFRTFVSMTDTANEFSASGRLHVWPSQDRIADILNVSRQAVQQSITRLINRGLIRVIKIGGKGRNIRNQYELIKRKDILTYSEPGENASNSANIRKGGVARFLTKDCMEGAKRAPPISPEATPSRAAFPLKQEFDLNQVWATPEVRRACERLVPFLDKELIARAVDVLPPPFDVPAFWSLLLTIFRTNHALLKLLSKLGDGTLPHAKAWRECVNEIQAEAKHRKMELTATDLTAAVNAQWKKHLRKENESESLD